MVAEIEKFYGCYLLVSASAKFKGWTYIGFTVDPNRRSWQHNCGRQKGGAWRTSGKGPWDMVLIIHGFPNKISALQFEWAWQNPEKSSKLKHACIRHKRLKGFKYRFAIVSEMLRTGPWNRLPLTIRWLNQDYVTEFDVDIQPPNHMPITYGPVKISKPAKPMNYTDHQKLDSSSEANTSCCSICNVMLVSPADGFLKCLNKDCGMRTHILCLAEDFLSQDHSSADMLIPVCGDCVICGTSLLWGDLIKQKLGCYQTTHNTQNVEECIDNNNKNDAADHWSSALTQS